MTALNPGNLTTGKSALSPVAGDFAVIITQWSIEAREITRVTPQCVYFKRFEGGREGRADKGSVVFAGSEDEAKALREKLVSSDALRMQETGAACRRQEARDVKLIQEANELRARITSGEPPSNGAGVVP
jgi:hypothetical protein